MSKSEVEFQSEKILADMEITIPNRLYPTIEEFLSTVPILQYDIEGYITDTRGAKDWGADAIADFSSRLGVATKSVKSEVIDADENGEGGEWKIHAEVEFVDTKCTEIAEITQPRMTKKTDFKTKEQYEEDDPFGLEKAVSRAIRNAKKRAFPAKRLLQMLFDAKKARDDARSELRKQMGAYKEAGASPRDLIDHAECEFGLEQDAWQCKQWNAFKEGITDGASTGEGLFYDIINKPAMESNANEVIEDNTEKENENTADADESNVLEVSEDNEDNDREDTSESDDSAEEQGIPEDYE